MTLVEIRTLAKLLYYSATGKKDIDDVQWNAIINVFNRVYWTEATTAFASLFAVDSADLSTTGQGTYDYSALNVHKLLDVAFKYSGEYVSLPYEVPVDRKHYNTQVAGASISAAIPSAYTLLGEVITLLPAMNSSQTIRITHIVELADMTSDATQAISGQLPVYHPLLAYEAALSLVPGNLGNNISRAAMMLRTQWKEHMQSRQRSGRSIRYVPYE